MAALCLAASGHFWIPNKEEAHLHLTPLYMSVSVTEADPVSATFLLRVAAGSLLSHAVLDRPTHYSRPVIICFLTVPAPTLQTYPGAGSTYEPIG